MTYCEELDAMNGYDPDFFGERYSSPDAQFFHLRSLAMSSIG